MLQKGQRNLQKWRGCVGKGASETLWKASPTGCPSCLWVPLKLRMTLCIPRVTGCNSSSEWERKIILKSEREVPSSNSVSPVPSTEQLTTAPTGQREMLTGLHSHYCKARQRRMRLERRNKLITTIRIQNIDIS